MAIGSPLSRRPANAKTVCIARLGGGAICNQKLQTGPGESAFRHALVKALVKALV